MGKETGPPSAGFLRGGKAGAAEFETAFFLLITITCRTPANFFLEHKYLNNRYVFTGTKIFS